MSETAEWISIECGMRGLHRNLPNVAVKWLALLIIIIIKGIVGLNQGPKTVLDRFLSSSGQMLEERVR
jgi:hypothetical protein